MFLHLGSIVNVPLFIICHCAVNVLFSVISTVVVLSILLLFESYHPTNVTCFCWFGNSPYLLSFVTCFVVVSNVASSPASNVIVYVSPSHLVVTCVFCYIYYIIFCYFCISFIPSIKYITISLLVLVTLRNFVHMLLLCWCVCISFVLH